jgi:hypothetical protein
MTGSWISWEPSSGYLTFEKPFVSFLGSFESVILATRRFWNWSTGRLALLKIFCLVALHVCKERMVNRTVLRSL